MWWIKRGGGRFAVGAGDADHAMRRQVRAGPREQFDIADDRHARFVGMRHDRVPVERHAGRDDHRLIASQIDFERIGEIQILPGTGRGTIRRMVEGDVGRRRGG
jgi:hypothetical protein